MKNPSPSSESKDKGSIGDSLFPRKLRRVLSKKLNFIYKICLFMFSLINNKFLNLDIIFNSYLKRGDYFISS